MGKKGKSKQGGQAAEPALVTQVSSPPDVQETQENGFANTAGAMDDDWGMSVGEMENDGQDYEEIKPVKPPSVSASSGYPKSAQMDHASALANAIAAAFPKESGGEKSTKENGGTKVGSAKPGTKGGVTWDDGGWDDNPSGKDYNAGKTSWPNDDHTDDDDWGESGVDYEEWEGAQGESSRWPNTDNGWEHHQHQHNSAISHSSALLATSAAQPQSQQPAKAWMSWGEEAQRLAKVNDAATSSVGSRNTLFPQQQPQILHSLLNQPLQSYSAQHQVSSDPYAIWHGEQTKNQGGKQQTQQNGQTWHTASTKAGPSQSEYAWGNPISTTKGGYHQTESAWHTPYTKTGHAEQKKTQKSSHVSQTSKSGRKEKKNKEEHGHRRGRSQSRTSGGWGESWGDDWGNDRWGNGNDWNDWNADADDWNRDRSDRRKGGTDWDKGGSDWNKGGNDLNKGGSDWNKGGSDWNKGGGDWNKGGSDWNKGKSDLGKSGKDRNKGGSDWDDWNKGESDWNKDGDDWNGGGGDWNRESDWNKGGSDWGRSRGGDWERDREDDWGDDWGNTRANDDDDDGDAWNRHSRFSAKGARFSGSYPAGPTYSMPSKTMAHAYSSLPSNFPRDSVPNSMNEYADLRFVESKGAALEPVKQALFGRARLAKDRIHWMFPSDKDERVATLLSWIQKVSYNLASFGLHKFLQSRERGALVANADFRPGKSVNEPAFDWLTFDQLQKTRDQILQESVAFYDPAVQVIVFVFLPSKSGNSMAAWRRKIKVPNNLRLAYQREITLAMAALRKEKDYVVHVDEMPSSEDRRRSAHKPKRKWWQIFG